MSYDSAFLEGKSFSRFIDEAKVNKGLWAELAERAPLDEAAAGRISRSGGPWRLLVLVDDWCGDALNTLPFISRLADASENVELRIVPRDDFREIRDRHLTRGSRSIPIVILLDADGVARGSWGPRPTLLQALFEGGLRTLPSKERYRELRRCYARDRGASTAREITELFERGAKEVGSVTVEV